MKTNALRLLLPTGRLVGGSLYNFSNKKMDGSPLTYKNGDSRIEYYIAYAIKKTTADWRQETWGALIYQYASQIFPAGQYNTENFAWKIKDGDSQKANDEGKKLCDYIGYAGHWVLSLKNGFTPKIVNPDGTPFLKPELSINLGDYVQSYLSIVSNMSLHKPGIHLNFTHVAFIGYGEPIIYDVDPSSIGFNKNLPQGASATPLKKMVQGTTNAPSLPQQPYVPATVTVNVAPPPYPQILSPGIAPPPKSTIKTMLTQNGTYEDYLAQGWTDELLVQHGIMSISY